MSPTHSPCVQTLASLGRARSFFVATVAVVWLSQSAPALAVDAATQLRQYQQETLRRLTPPAPAASTNVTTQIGSPSQAGTASTERIMVQGFAVTGVTVFSQEELFEALRPHVGKELDTAGIHAAADALTALYRRAGYFVARAYIPPQQVAGIIQLDVLEGRLDGTPFEVINRGSRIKSEVVQSILEANIPADQPIRNDHHERALLLAEDLPGVTTSSTLYPGEWVGSARLRTTLTDLPLLSGNVDVDDFGYPSTGRFRLGSTIYLNSPTQVGDQLVGRLVTSGHRSSYAYLTYLRPISPLGTRAGLSADHLVYHADPITDLGKSSGHATDLRTYLTHPIVRSRHRNLSVRADVFRQDLRDRNDLQINGHRHLIAAQLGLQGDDEHAGLGAGLTTFSTSVTSGRTSIRGNILYRQLDEQGAQTGGSFTRLNLGLTRMQYLTPSVTVLATVNAQWASTALDGSQKYYLGGPVNNAGYPIAEAGGDMGADLQLELRKDLPLSDQGVLTLGVFHQTGWIKQHESAWPGWQGTKTHLHNEVALRTVGLSATVTVMHTWVVRGLVGWQTGNHPLASPATGTASDGRRGEHRSWLQVIRYF